MLSYYIHYALKLTLRNTEPIGMRIYLAVVINFALVKLLRTATEEKVRERERERERETESG